MTYRLKRRSAFAFNSTAERRFAATVRADNLPDETVVVV